MNATHLEERTNGDNGKLAYEPPKGIFVSLKLEEGIQITARGGSPYSYCAEGCLSPPGSCGRLTS